MGIYLLVGLGRILGPGWLHSWGSVREKLPFGEKGQGRTRKQFESSFESRLAHLVAGLAALVAGRVALGLSAVGAQVARLAAVEALAVQRPLLARHLACRRNVADLATVVAGDPAAAGVAAAGGEVSHTGAQSVHVDQLRAVALQVAGLAADVASLGVLPSARKETGSTSVRAQEAHTKEGNRAG